MEPLRLLLTDPKLRSIFSTVSQNRVMKIGDLVSASGPKEGKESTRGMIQQLKDARLVDVQNALLNDFDMVYVTADGLEVSRKLNRERL